MSKDLWSFGSAEELKKQTEDLPDAILKEQIWLLGEKTGFILYGRPVFIKVDAENNLIALKGAVPGPKGGIVTITNSVKKA